MQLVPDSRLARIAICLAAGVILFLSCADYDIWPLCWLGFVPALFVVLDDKCESPFFYGWVAGLTANGGGFYWINSLLMRFGHMPFIASAPIYALLIGYQALAFGAFAWCVRKLRDRLHLPMFIVAPIAMTAIELVMPFIFPWYLAITQAWVRPIIQIADLTGPLGVTFLLMLSNGALYDTALALSRREKPSWKPLGVTVITVVIALVYGQIRIHQVEAMRAQAPSISIGVVQANIGINEKFHESLRTEQLAVHQRLSADLERRGADLIVWPESSYPYALDRRQTMDFPAHDRRQVMRGFKTPLFFGALTMGPDSEFPFNTALLLDPDGTIRGTFDKNFLLVFGEYIPFYERMKWIRDVIPEASNFARGDTVTTFPLAVPKLGRDIRLGPMICYEDIIPSFGRRLVAQHPNVLVNITNDAWFGATSEPWEHLALAVYRSVEHRLDLVRSVNTGVSAFVDATGKVYAHGPAVDPVITPNVAPITLLEKVAVLDASGLYGRIGDTFGALNLIALCGLGAWARKRSGKPVRLGAHAIALGLLGAGVGLAVLSADPTHPRFAFSLLAHTPGVSNDETFTVGARLVLGCGLACLASGFLLRKIAHGEPRLEGGAAAIIVFIAPVLFFGRIEGETAPLVFTLLGGIGLVIIGIRLARPRKAPSPIVDAGDDKQGDVRDKKKPKSKR